MTPGQRDLVSVESIQFYTEYGNNEQMILTAPLSLRTIGAVVQGGSTIFCAGSPMGCMKPWKFQVGYSEIGCEVRQFYLNVSTCILFVLLLSIQVNVISLVRK